MTQNISLSQKQAQVQSLTPQQMQAMKLLQATTQELEQQLKQEMMTNPAIEFSSGMEVLAGNPLEDSLGKGDYEEDRAANLAEHDENLADAAFLAKDGGNPIDESSTTTWSADQEEKRQHFFNSLTAPPSFQELLLQQLRDAVEDDKSPLFKACQEVLGNIDDSGYLRASDNEIAAGAGIPLETATKAVDIIRTFTPAGIGGRNLREVLLLQLERNREKGSLAWDIVDKHLNDLARNKIPQIAKDIDADVSEVQDAITRIRELNPRPGREVSEKAAPTIIPEVTIFKNADGEWDSSLTNEAFPQVTISPDYEAMQHDKSLNKEDRAFVTKKIEEGKQLINCLDFRKTTIERIADALINLQPDFFNRGESGLKPMVMSEVADLIGVHESTVSRAISNKYLRTPWGVYSFRFFFSTGYKQEDMPNDAAVSNHVIKNRIREMIEHEDPQKPLSDQKLAELLSANGVTIARRTVAKYREEIGLPAASLRKIHG